MKRRSVSTLLAGLALPASSAFAQFSSGRPLRLIVPIGPGSFSDTFARMLAPRLGVLLNQPVIVETKAGGNGLIGVQELMRSAPDGNTVMLSSASALAINMAVLKNPQYDSRRDFTPIAGGYVASQAWMVHGKFPALTFADLIAYAKSNPGKLKAGESSTLVKIQYSVFENMIGTELLQVSYKSLNTATMDLAGGTIDLFVQTISTAHALAKNGQVRGLGVSSPKRNPLVPDWPAIAEFLPGFDCSSWSALVGPANMPREVVNRINAAVTQVLNQPDFADNLIQGGSTPFLISPEQLKAFIETEVTRWTRMARQAKIEPE